MVQPLYSAFVLLSTSLTTWAAQPPGRPRLFVPPGGRFYLWKIMLAVYTQLFAPCFGLPFAFISLYYPHPPPGSIISPQAMRRLNADLFTFSTTSVILCALMIIGGGGRRLAMHQLGKSFTWELQQPPKLYQGGIYRYIQHPSYSFGLACSLAAQSMFVRTDGVLVFLGPSIARGLVLLCWAQLAVFILSIPVRIRGEEAMLKNSFGKEWETWHQKTARFVPGVF
jgi:protein-S-isoprenylcysteine O-methyltransferase Ste14